MPSILIIDDDDSLRDALRRTLHKEGYTIMEASHGGRGLKQLESASVDIVLLDMFMPEKDGLETSENSAARILESESLRCQAGGSKARSMFCTWRKRWVFDER